MHAPSPHRIEFARKSEGYSHTTATRCFRNDNPDMRGPGLCEPARTFDPVKTDLSITVWRPELRAASVVNASAAKAATINPAKTRFKSTGFRVFIPIRWRDGHEGRSGSVKAL